MLADNDSEKKLGFTGGKGPWLVVLVIFTLIAVGVGYFIVKPSFGDKIVVEDQPVGDTFRIKEVILSKPGFLVFEFFSPTQSGLTLVASSGLIPPGTYTDIEIRVLPIPQDEQIGEAYILKRGDTIFATTYNDTNGNAIYDQGTDSPRRNLFGQEARTKFKLQ